ncbi:MAG: monovalent cation/H(+) antiporter subunit G [Alphaproteobacteria bacterium]|nr:monovalent cation/H(+) antiporter subunit G [Rickettsiales bacterium]
MMIYIGISLLVTGLALAFAVGIATMKQSNSYTLMHISAITDAVGSVLVILGLSILLFYEGNITQGIKLILLALLIYVVNPMSSYSLTKALYFYDNETMDHKA